MPNSSAPDGVARKAAALPREFTGRHMLAIMVMFFATIIVANATLAFFALHSWTGLVVPNSYVASQKFNEQTASRLEAANAGAKASVSEEQGYIHLRFEGKQHEPLSAGNLSAKLRHPVDAQQETVVEFSAEGAGWYKSLKPLPQGAWIGDISGDLKDYGHWAEAVRFAVEE